MSSYNVLRVHQSEDVVFDDLVLLNQELDQSGAGELWLDYDDIITHRDWAGWIRLQDGEVQIAETVEHSFGGYGSHCVVYGCFGIEEAEIIANRMTSGKLVFRYSQEGGWPDIFYVLTPGDAKRVDTAKLAF